MGDIADRVEKTRALHERVEKLTHRCENFVHFDPKNPSMRDNWRPLVAMERWLEVLASQPEFVEGVFGFGEPFDVTFFDRKKGDGPAIIKEAHAMLSKGLPKDIHFQPPLKVRAKTKGEYGGIIREPGDVFQIKKREEFGRWMEVVGQEKSTLPVEDLEKLINVRWRLPRPDMVLQSIVYGARDDDGNLRAERMSSEQYELLDQFESLLNIAIKEESGAMKEDEATKYGATRSFDVFISHASEDKEPCVRPLVQKLRAQGVRVWLDESEVTIGDKLGGKIDEGLKSSTFGIVILSPAFFRKEWPKRELEGLYSKEREGRKVILPVWFQIDKEGVEANSPMLAGRVAGKFSDGLGKLVHALLLAMGKGPNKKEIEDLPAEATIPEASLLQLRMIRRRWVTEGPPGLPPLYVELEFDYVSDNQDAVRSVVAEIAGHTVEAEHIQGFPRFDSVTYVRWLFKFIPVNYRNASESIPITIKTSRGLTKSITIEASPGSFTGKWPEVEFENGFEKVKMPGHSRQSTPAVTESLTIEPTSTNWIVDRQGPSALYVTVELQHTGKSQDAVSRVTAYLQGFHFQDEGKTSFPKLQPVDFHELELRFNIPQWKDMPYDIPITVHTVLKKTAMCQVRAWPKKHLDAPHWRE